jgi:hypothetical protein
MTTFALPFMSLMSLIFLRCKVCEATTFRICFKLGHQYGATFVVKIQVPFRNTGTEEHSSNEYF